MDVPEWGKVEFGVLLPKAPLGLCFARFFDFVCAIPFFAEAFLAFALAVAGLETLAEFLLATVAVGCGEFDGNLGLGLSTACDEAVEGSPLPLRSTTGAGVLEASREGWLDVGVDMRGMLSSDNFRFVESMLAEVVLRAAGSRSRVIEAVRSPDSCSAIGDGGVAIEASIDLEAADLKEAPVNVGMSERGSTVAAACRGDSSCITRPAARSVASGPVSTPSIGSPDNSIVYGQLIDCPFTLTDVSRPVICAPPSPCSHFNATSTDVVTQWTFIPTALGIAGRRLHSHRKMTTVHLSRRGYELAAVISFRCHGHSWRGTLSNFLMLGEADTISIDRGPKF